MPLFTSYFSPVVWLSNRFLQGKKAAPHADPADGKQMQWARRGEIHGIKGWEDKTASLLNTEVMTPLWCGNMRSKCAAHWEEGGGRLGPSTHADPVPSTPATSCEQGSCMAPPAPAVKAERAQLGRDFADGRRLHCLCTTLSSMGRENLSFLFPRGLGVGSMGAAPFPLTGLAQAQSVAAQHS